ncbi:MAG: SAM-dependent methyltransferase [Actinomycetota bacterium]|nr:SAM-dependent methyltransferase [Actinomycetota bacterium]
MERISRRGPLSFAEYVELALYDAATGFFGRGGGAGREGHFLTSPEVGPLFAAVVARAVDRWWEELGRPDPFVVIEAGAGRGTLAGGVLAARPACAPALRYVLVERSEALRARQCERLALESPAGVLGPVGGDDDGDPSPQPGAGPMVTSLADLPAAPVTGVVLANELLDNLPFSLLERSAEGWGEVRVGLEGGRLVEMLVPAPPALAAEADRLAPAAPAGGRVPLQREASRWLRRALSRVERGCVVVIDYADVTASLARRPWTEWVRTYVAHARGAHPLDRAGEQDVTCEVAVDQLARVRRPDRDRSQAEFLADHGIAELVGEARQAWHARAAAPDLEALRHRSRVAEASALTDPAGLGGFRVLEWDVGRRRSGRSAGADGQGSSRAAPGVLAP